MIAPQDIQNWISLGLENSEVTVDGDGQHFEAIIICPDFEGKSLIQRHKMVYSALGDKMKSEIHALSMKTLTPAEL
ncbi:BolA family protein [Candidatus Spongiihabitans sp.]|uniref:BolA family protein n=1 Tax=Candidatus Spongiihabitans sp. TaxID=3101308 RepID=UPI003C6EB5CE